MSVIGDVRSSVSEASASDLEEIARAGVGNPFLELGQTGLKRSAGIIDEEFLPQLRGRKAIAVYKEMSENDPTVGSMMFAIVNLLRNVEWRVEPAGKSAADAKAAEFVETCMHDMAGSWGDFITEVLSSLVYGWSWHEIVYKRRSDPWSEDPRKRSRYTDGLIGWRKMPIRAQETLIRWVFDDSGDVAAMVQMAPPRYATTVLPMRRSLLFRYRHLKGSPEGVSLLRNAYRPWYFKKRIEEIEAVGVERDLAGLPIVKVPAEFLRAKPGTDQAKTVDAFKKLVKSVRRDEQEGLVFPQAYDQDTKQPLYTFELLGGGGSRVFNTDGIIRRYEERILSTVLADFIMVGHQQSGSYSMHVDKTGIFRTALNSVLDGIAEVLNRHAIPRLFNVNGWKPAELPKIMPADVDAPDIAQLASFMTSMQSAGVSWFPDGDLENFVRSAARLPKLDKESVERRRQLQMRSEATTFAESNTAYVTALQQHAMASLNGSAQDPGGVGQQQQQQQEQKQQQPAQKAIGGKP